MGACSSMSIDKTNETIETGLSNADKSYIFIARKTVAPSVNLDKKYWKNGLRIEWSKYQIKESDMRSMTASFTTNQYLDLTTGQYTVLITSPYHQSFGGVIISVDYDDKTDLYTYQCQDFSRMYQSKVDLVVNNVSVHRILQYLITRGAINLKGDVSSKLKKYKELLSGLRPASHYWERAWGGLTDSNPMAVKKKMIIRNKSFIEVIRDLAISKYVDVYFDKYGIIHIEPYVKSEWLNTGLILTMPEIASLKPKFDTTNIITGVTVHNTDKLKAGTDYESSSLVNLDLSAFFGDLRTSIDNPNQSTGNASNSSSKNKTSSKTSKTKTKGNNIYGTGKKVIYLNTDSITSYSADMKRMEDMKKILKKNGWEVHIVGVGSETHYKRRNEVKKGIWFCLYGGVCAGTLREHCTSKWFLEPLKKNKSRVVVGFFPPSKSIKKGGKYYKHLPPAHDWQNNRAYANIDYPAKFLSKYGIPWMYADNAKEMASKFLAGGDNYKIEGNSYKYYDSWQKHKLKWL